jgi:hypothetical protein
MNAGKMPNEVYERAKVLQTFSHDSLEAAWKQSGSETAEDYGLCWYWGSSGGGWATLDDSASRKQFMLSVPREGLNSPMVQERWEKIAVIIAKERGLVPLAQLTDVAPNPVSEKVQTSYVPAEDYFVFTASNFQTHNQRVFKALETVDLLAAAMELLKAARPGISKSDFIAMFLDNLILAGVIMEIVPVKKLEVHNDIELDRVNHEFLKAWLA